MAVHTNKACKLPFWIVRKVVIFALILLIIVCWESLLFYTEQSTTTKTMFLNHGRKVSVYQTTSKYLTYHPPINMDISGKFFPDVNKTILENLLPKPEKLDKNKVKNIIFVTAISSGFYPRVTLLVESVQKYFPDNRLIIYDLGLTNGQLQKMKSWCRIQIKKVDLKKYPPHVGSLHSYAFKPIVIADAFRNFNATGVFWVDSSVRFLQKDISELEKVSLGSNGVTAFPGTGHSVFSVTPPEMFQYLPSVKDPKKTECIMATLVLLYKTEQVINNILKWWLSCALSEKCIWSIQNKICHFQKGDRWKVYANCSRYDQSALSIILYNSFEDTKKIFAPKLLGNLRVSRGGEGGTIKMCNT